MSRPYNPNSLRSQVLLHLLWKPSTRPELAAALGVTGRRIENAIRMLAELGFVQQSGISLRTAKMRGRTPGIYSLTLAGRARARSLDSEQQSSRLATPKVNRVAVVARRRSFHIAPPCRIGRGSRWFVEHV